jgi:transmembrane 9 superfamily protein 2/4
MRIVGFEVVPFSINHQHSTSPALPTGDLEDLKLKTCTTLNPAVNDPANFMMIPRGAKADVIFTYDIDWVADDTVWANRWDIYLRGNPDDEIHIFAIVNSLMIIIFLSGIVAMILLRTLHKEIAEYNELSTLEEAQEESGWKLVHGDVFRPPRTFPMALSIFLGTGCQIGTALACLLLLACLGFLTPTDKGQALTMVILLYVFCGSFGGYWSARSYKLFGGKDWKSNTIATATFFPGCLVFLFLILNIGLQTQKAATAVSFTTILAVFLLWVGVSTPLMFVGSYFGFRKEAISVPLKANHIARIIPTQTTAMHPAVITMIGGILPFGSVCIELFFIMSSLWLSQIYYVFGFLFIVVLILVLTCAEISIVLTYFQLTNEDYRWWWRSFAGCASSGVYLFLYSIWYYQTKLDYQGFLTGMVYFTYNIIISMAFGLFTGSIGFFSSLIFVKKIYAALKVD